MAAIGLIIKIPASFLLWYLVSYLSLSDVSSFIGIGGVPERFIGSSPKVKVEFYMESLCIDCQRFMIEQLQPTYELLGDAVVDLTVVPYGNAQIDVASKRVACQHGAAECDTNSFEQCAIHTYPYPARYLPFMHCLDQTLPMGHHDEPFPRRAFAECARRSALDFAAIAACRDDDELAWRLQRRAARATPEGHTHVPWVVVNGRHTMDEDADSLLEVVCHAYRAGGGRHPACVAAAAGPLRQASP